MDGANPVANLFTGQAVLDFAEKCQLEGKSILAVGNLDIWRGLDSRFSSEVKLTFVEFRNLDVNLLQSVRPDIVIAPLLSAGFDCLELAQLLGANSFKGHFWILSPKLPAPDIVKWEISVHCPNVDFGLCETDGWPNQ